MSSLQSDERFMWIAIEEAFKCKGEKKFGAIIVDAGEIIVRAYSSVREDDDLTAHAEIKAVRQASVLFKQDIRLLRDCTLYATCEPCIMCQGAIGWARIGRVVAGMRRSDSPHNFFDSEPWHRSFQHFVRDMRVLEYRDGVLADQCAKLLMPRP